jgi:predicted XRE-type DNA-binding protein
MINYIDKIKAYINKSGITQVEFAKRVKIEKRRVNRLICRDSKMNQDDVDKIYKFFKDIDETKRPL